MQYGGPGLWAQANLKRIHETQARKWSAPIWQDITQDMRSIKEDAMHGHLSPYKAYINVTFVVVTEKKRNLTFIYTQ